MCERVDARIVDQDIDVAIGRERLVHAPVDLGFISNIQADGNCSRQPLRQRLGACFIEIGDDDSRTVCGEKFCYGTADSAGCTGDERDLAGEIGSHDYASLKSEAMT